jgi:uncharacterized flavoprotein (TIGR03862 family)
MAAEVARAAGASVHVYEGKASGGRKFLLAGKGGLNLTHSEAFEAFVARYGARANDVRAWLTPFDNDAVRAWARGLGIETMIGTSGRVFPSDLKAAPLLRHWHKRLREQGVRFHVRHYCVGVSAARELTFRTPDETVTVKPDAIVFALGGGSWPELGSDGAWVNWLDTDIAPLEASNCGFDVEWSKVLLERYAGQPVKSVRVSTEDGYGVTRTSQGEFIVTQSGVEGGAIYALSSALRARIHRDGTAVMHVDLAPQRDRLDLEEKLSRPVRGRSVTEHLRRALGIEGVKTALLYEFVPRTSMGNAEILATAIKSLPIRLVRPRPIAEAISSAGGVRFEALDASLMLRSRPGIFCAGEMLDWEAPTGGYLLTACFASGRVAGAGAAAWAKRSHDDV